jgi:hypothetical protein
VTTAVQPPSASALLPRTSPRAIFDRVVRVTVNGFAMEGLRVGFTIDKNLKVASNTAEISIYNLSRQTRERMHASKVGIPVVVEAGYRATGLSLLFVGEMREAFSRPEPDGTWATILRAGDGDSALRGVRNRTSLRPGVSVERLVGEQFKQLGVGLGNAFTEFKNQIKGGDVDAERLGAALGSGFVMSGAAKDAMEQITKSAGVEYSVQNGQLQVLKKGEPLGVRAPVLGPDSGLDGSPSIDAQGTMHLRARLLPNLFPGMPIQVTHYRSSDLELFHTTKVYPATLDTIYRIEKVRFVGDLWGDDWNAEIEARDPKLGPKKKKKAKRA